MILTKENINTMAEMAYMKDANKDSWKDLDEIGREKYRKKVLSFIDDLAKINFEPRPLGEFKITRQNLKVINDRLTGFIRDFIKNKVKVPKDLINIFPADALSNDIVKEFAIKE